MTRITVTATDINNQQTTERIHQIMNKYTIRIPISITPKPGTSKTGTSNN